MASDPTTTRTYSVSGMTCGHCEASVREEVGEVAGVTRVTADRASGLVEVTGAGPIDDAAIEAAVRLAGYEVVR
ncbi:MAG: heavy-metal-associated domain-containing protein [Patulibacter minatonensis]